jgi:hypothetical protein
MSRVVDGNCVAAAAPGMEVTHRYGGSVTTAPARPAPARATSWSSSSGLVLGVVVGLALGAVVALALVGIPLAVAGWYRPWLVLPALVAGAVGGARVLGPALRPVRVAPPALAIVVVGIALVTATSLWRPSQHQLTDRDPGAYTVTAQWLAANGDLLVVGLEGPFTRAGGLGAGSLAFDDAGRPDGRLYAQFVHLTPAALAVGHWLGGDAALERVMPVVGAAALLALFALLAHHVRSSLAAVATLALAFSVPQWWFSRDTYSEPLTQFLVVGGLLALTVGLRRRSWAAVALAGLALGSTVAARIDGLLIVVSVSALAGAWVARPGWGRRAGLVLAVATVPPVLAGAADLVWRSPNYLAGHRGLVAPAAVAVVVALLTAPVAVLAADRVTALRRAGARWGPRLAMGASVALVCALVAAWQLRPLVQTVREEPAHPGFASLLAAEGITDGARVFTEHAVDWAAWYLGPVAVAVAVAGLGIALHRGLTRGGEGWLLLAVLGPTALAYWWDPGAAPDHPWVMRRYLPAVLPLVIFGLAVGLDWLWDRRDVVGRAAAVATAAVILTVPAAISLPLLGARELFTTRHSIDELCRALGPDAAAVFLRGHRVDEQFPVTARVRCGIPTAAGDPWRDYGPLADAWAAEGRRLILVASVFDTTLGRPVVATIEYPVEHLRASISRRTPDLHRNRGAVNLYDP